MGLFQRAVETYDCNASRIGIYYADESEPLAPIGHMIAKANVEITLDQDGNYISASMVDKGDEKTIIPTTEASMGRTSSAKKNPHPLCDKLKYIIAEENYYIPQLEAWCASAFSLPKLQAVLQYVKKRTIRQDLEPYQVSDDAFVRWRVVGLGEDSGACWTDKKLFQSYISYVSALQSESSAFCMVTGEEAPNARQHAKGVVALNGNAKLISANDDAGFTYRGRFTDEIQAASISYTASQKAHNALRWLVANQGKPYGGRTFLCWSPQGIRVGSPVQVFYQAGSANRVKPSDYKEQLAATLLGRKKELRLQGNEAAVIAVFDAATTGRLALTYYNELSVSSFLNRMCRWDEYCCWWNGRFGIQPPSILQLVNCAFGTQRIENKEAKLVTDDRVMRQELQTLLACRLSEAAFPEHICAALVQRAGTPQAYEPKVWRSILHSACSAIQMTTIQRRGEEIMSWSLDKPDRSFQFGRLLAAMERAEEDYYYLTGETGRQTNAMKQMSVFRQRPWTVYEQVNRQLNNAYLPRLKPWQRVRYQRLKDEIVAILSNFPETELNRPLNELYLMGYDLQHNAFFKNETETEETENE